MKELNRRQFFNVILTSSVTAVGAAVMSATQKTFAVIPEESKAVHAKHSVSVPKQQPGPEAMFAQYGSIRRQCRRRNRKKARRVRRRSG